MNDSKPIGDHITLMSSRCNKHIELLKKRLRERNEDTILNDIQGTAARGTSSTPVGDSKPVVSISNPGKYISANNIEIRDGGSIPVVNPINPPITTQVPTPVPTPCNKYDYIITFKNRAPEVLILNPSDNPDIAESIKIEDWCFLDNKPSIHFPPEYSKHVNIGDSILITGGMDKGVSIKECFFLKVSRDRNKHNMIITSYPPMIDKRERHNLIYLEDIKAVLACGGFYTKSAEITSLEGRNWTEIALMKEQRANATMLYHNNKTVYCFGGFHVGERANASTGSYLGSCEFIDVKSPAAIWNFVDLEAVYKVNLKLCAMGVISLRPNNIFLLGGYDGHKYLSCMHEIIFEDDKIAKIQRRIDSHPAIPRGVIFPTSAEFLRWGDTFYNFDFQMKIVQFDSKNANIISK